MSQMNRRPGPGAPARPAQRRMDERPAARRDAPEPRPAAGRTAPPERRPAQGQRQAAPRGGDFAPGGGRSPWADVALIAVVGAVAAVLALVLQMRWPNGFPLVGPAAQPASSAVRTVSEIHSNGPLRINEIMTGNRRVLTAEDGSTPDWVEIANAGETEVALGGWSLAKTEGGTGVFTFPDMKLAPGECALVLADSRLRAEAGEALHAPFRLSSSGDTLMLFNAAGTAVDTVNIPALPGDSSYVRSGAAQWTQSSTPTPGLPNDEASYRLLTVPSGDSPVVVSRIVASNAALLAAGDGMYYDFIELYNRSGDAVDLTGWCLSDDAQKPRKWSFPEAQIAPGEKLVVFASGLDRRDDPAQLHTNFSLSSEGESVVLTDGQGRMMDRVDYGLLKADEAWTLESAVPAE